MRLIHGAEALQLEKEMLSVTVDVETGAADALVLEGANTGRMWSSLSAPEKAGIGMAITDMAGRVFLDILEIGSV